MANNFWDALEGKPSSEPSTSKAAPTEASPSQAAPAFIPAPIATNKKTSQPDSVVFKPDAVRTAERAAAAANVVKQNMPEPVAASPTEDFMDNILGLWQIPAAIAGAEVVRRGYKAFKEAGAPAQTKSILDSDIQFNRPAETDAIARPTTAAPAPTQTVMTAGGPVNLSEVPPEMRPMVEKSAQVTQQKMTAGPVAPPIGAPAPVAPIEVPTLSQTLAQGGNVTKAVQADIAQQIDTTPAVAPSATPAVAPSATPAATTATQPVAPKDRVKSTFKSAADIPAGMVFRADVGNVDRALFNILGPEHRQNAKDLLNKGQPFGNAPDVNDRVSKITSEYWKAVQGQIPETILSREARIAQGVPHQGFGSFGGLGRAVKVGGVAGTLLTAAEAALAAQQGRYGEAAMRGADVATDFIPGVAAAKQAFTGTTVVPGTLPPGYVENAALLGSPYYDTEWSKTQRMKERAGAGRGFVNPPQFR